ARPRCIDAVDPGTPARRDGRAALRSRREFTLVRAGLWLAVAGFGLGAARDVSVGRLAAPRALHRRGDCIPHLAFRVPAQVPFDGGICGSFRRHFDPWSRSECRIGATRPAQIPEQSEPMDRARGRRRIPWRRDLATPSWGADLIGFYSRLHQLRGESDHYCSDIIPANGEMAEWSNAPDSKSGLGQPNGGSNPSLSATYCRLNACNRVQRRLAPSPTTAKRPPHIGKSGASATSHSAQS